MGNFVAGRLYTITKIGTVGAGNLSTNLAEWSALGVEGAIYPGKQFICAQAPADQHTQADAYAIEHYSIGDYFDCTVPGESVPNANLINLKNQTLASGEHSTTANPDVLPVSKFFTKKDDPGVLEKLIPEADFWTDGKLKLQGTLHPDFQDLVGGAVLGRISKWTIFT